jgi:methyl-accepting chemotaxis protein
MSQNNIPATLPSVERLLNRIAVAERSQQKDVRISVQEARELANDLALLTVKMSKTVQEVHQMLKEIKESTTNIDVKFDGGGF